MKIMVTGGAGFIGSHIVDRLISQGHDVIIIDNLLTGSKENINSKAIFYEEDICNLEKLDEIFSHHKPEYVFHTAAGYLVQSLSNPQRDASINIIGTINLIQMCLKHNVKKIIYSNSGGASYGEPLEIPMTEEHSINPLTPYGASKHTAEHYLYMYHKNFNLNYTSLRYANVYGPRQNPKLEGGVVSVFLDSLLRGERPEMKSDGTPTRDYVYVDDVVDANILAIQKGKCDAYHVSTGIETSVIELFNTIQKALNVNIGFIQGLPRIGDPQRAVFSNNKLKNELGWSPKTSLEDGVKKTAEWARLNVQKNKQIRALILAAGIGERMLPLTKEMPKPMLPINNKPILEYLIMLFKKHNLPNIGITTFYLKDKIINHFKDGKELGVNLAYLEEPELISSAKAVKQMIKYMADYVVITNGDNLTDINLTKVIDFHFDKNADITLVSYQRDPSAPPSSQLDFDSNMKLLKYRERLSEEEMNNIPNESRKANMGIYIFKREVIESINDNEENSIGNLFPYFLQQRFKIYVYPIEKTSYFKEIGKMERYLTAKREIESGQVKLCL